MTVYLHCEGVTDYAVIPILMKKIKDIPEMEIQWVKQDELTNFTTHRKSNIVISGHYKLIKALAAHSLSKNGKYIAYHQDADRRFTERYNDIVSEFKLLNEKGFRCLAIVPKETIESWLLADVAAINSLGDGSIFIDQSPNPEDLWGDEKDGNSKHPKKYLIRNLEKLNIENNPEEYPAIYAKIAEEANIEVLKRRCPKSFGQFHTDIQSFIPKDSTS